MFTGGGPQPGNGRKPEILIKLSLPSTINKYRLKWNTADQRTRENREKKGAALSCIKPQNSNSTGCQNGKNKRQKKKAQFKKKRKLLAKMAILHTVTSDLMTLFRAENTFTSDLMTCVSCCNHLHFWPDDLCFVLTMITPSRPLTWWLVFRAENTFTSDLMTCVSCCGKTPSLLAWWLCVLF